MRLSFAVGPANTGGAGTAAAFYPGVQTAAKLPALYGLSTTVAGTVAVGRLPRLYGVATQTPPLHNFTLLVQSPGDMSIGSTATALTQAIMDRFTAVDAHTAAMTVVISDILSTSDSYSTLATVLQSLGSGMALSDFVGAVLNTNLTSTTTLSSVSVSTLNTVLALIDFVSMHDSQIAVATVAQLIATILALRDSVTNALYQNALSSATVSGSLGFSFAYYMNLLDQFHVSAVPANTALITAYLSDSMHMPDSLSGIAQLLLALQSGAAFSLTLNTGQDVYTAWVMTPESKALRSYTNFPFNSYAVLNGELYGACATGVYQMGGATDAGAAIQSAIRTGLLDFGTRRFKRIDRGYIGYTSNGTLALRVVATSNEGEKIEYTYAMTQQAANAPREGRIAIGRGTKSVYWSFELINTGGTTFELFDVTVLPMALTGRFT